MLFSFWFYWKEFIVKLLLFEKLATSLVVWLCLFLFYFADAELSELLINWAFVGRYCCYCLSSSSTKSSSGVDSSSLSMWLISFLPGLLFFLPLFFKCFLLCPLSVTVFWLWGMRLWRLCWVTKSSKESFWAKVWREEFWSRAAEF